MDGISASLEFYETDIEVMSLLCNFANWIHRSLRKDKEQNCKLFNVLIGFVVAGLPCLTQFLTKFVSSIR